MLVCAFLPRELAHETAGAARTRSSLRPHCFEDGAGPGEQCQESDHRTPLAGGQSVDLSVRGYLFPGKIRARGAGKRLLAVAAAGAGRRSATRLESPSPCESFWRKTRSVGSWTCVCNSAKNGCRAGCWPCMSRRKSPRSIDRKSAKRPATTAARPRRRMPGTAQEWTIFVTNCPPALLNWKEIVVLYTARDGQIERLFKLWKSYNHLADRNAASYAGSATGGSVREAHCRDYPAWHPVDDRLAGRSAKPLACSGQACENGWAC